MYNKIYYFKKKSLKFKILFEYIIINLYKNSI